MLKIKPVEKSDIEKLSAVYVLAFKLSAPEENWTRESAKTLIKFFIESSNALNFLCLAKGEIVGGVCGLAKPWWDGNRLVDTELFVHPDYQDQKIATALLFKYLSEAKLKFEARTIEAITFSTVDFPSKWYKKIGFSDKSDWKVMTGNVEQVLKLLAT